MVHWASKLREINDFRQRSSQRSVIFHNYLFVLLLLPGTDEIVCNIQLFDDETEKADSVVHDAHRNTEQYKYSLCDLYFKRFPSPCYCTVEPVTSVFYW